MFHVEFFCDDKMLAKFLWALNELGAYTVTSKPAPNNITKGAKGASANGAGPKEHKEYKVWGTQPVAEAWVAFARKRKLREVAAPNIKEFTNEIGFSRGSYTHVTGTLRALGLLKMKPGTIGSGARYIVILDKKVVAGIPKAAQKLTAKIREEGRAQRAARKAAAQQGAS